MIEYLLPQTTRQIFENRTHLAKTILSSLRQLNLEQVIELGAGYSGTGAQLCSEKPGLTYIEIDMVGVVSLKAELLGKKTPSNLHLIGADFLKDELLPMLRPTLRKTKRTAIVIEGVSSYLNEVEFDKLNENAEKLASYVGGATLISHEGRVTRGLFGCMLRSILSAITRSRHYTHFDSVEKAREYYAKRGFNSFELIHKDENQFIYAVKLH